MGKSSRIKKEKRMVTENLIQPKPTMDPKLVEAYVRGRNVGEKQGKIEGYERAIMMFNDWIEEIDKQAPGIGPKTKLAILEYIASKMHETINKNKNK